MTTSPAAIFMPGVYTVDIRAPRGNPVISSIVTLTVVAVAASALVYSICSASPHAHPVLFWPAAFPPATTDFIEDLLSISLALLPYLIVRAMESRKTVQIFVRHLSGRNITINVQSNSTIYDVKLQIQRKTSMPLTHQCLTFSGKSLNDADSLQNYEITKGATVNLVSRLRGAGRSKHWLHPLH